jgi:hypothetical protein
MDSDILLLFCPLAITPICVLVPYTVHTVYVHKGTPIYTFFEKAPQCIKQQLFHIAALYPRAFFAFFFTLFLSSL